MLVARADTDHPLLITRLTPGSPTHATAVPPTIGWAPRAPRAPIPRAVMVHLRGQRPLVREMPLLLVTLVLIVGLLRADVEAAADQWVGQNVVNVIAIN